MNTLVTLQDQFQDYLLHSSNKIHAHIVSTEKVPADTRLAIYNNAYWTRLLEALATTYPILKKYLGDEAFEKLGYDYINQYPSSYRSIRWFGDQLATFIMSPFLAELARFEWTMTLVFDAADSEVLQIAEVGRIPPEEWINMRFQAHPSAHRLNLFWNVVPIWQALAEEQSPIKPVQSPSPVGWMLWRKELISQFCSLPIEEAWAIDTLLKGATFGEICEGLCQWIEEEKAALHAASLLKGWLAAGLIRSLY